MRQTVKQSSLLTLLALVIGLGFVTTSLASYYASREAIRESIIGTELPLIADVMSGEIQKDLVRLVQVSSAMAAPPFYWTGSIRPKPTQPTHPIRFRLTHRYASGRRRV